MTDRNSFVCIHGHFYQPPRENPWLDAVPREASAAPYHDWNARITRECYGPNACARIPGPEGGILSLVNNYEFMSFNFGPTLLTWLSRNEPWIHEKILEADRVSMARRGGHGNAVAQVYNHIIMPLAGSRDKRTQVRWGVRDFKHRFGRPPEGMWLAETAVDNETLRLMAEEGVRFTILSPGQANGVRRLGPSRDGAWRELQPGEIETSRPYRVFPEEDENLSIDVFFYDDQLSRAVAYERLLASGDQFLGRIESTLDNGGGSARLVSVATDGESYGHHFKFGDMALAWLFRTLDKSKHPSTVNFGEFLERFPPDDEVRILENTSWSCAHGVERWRSDCGCSVHRMPGWNQAWRAPLRLGLDRLSVSLGEIFEEAGADVFFDPWEARDDYIELLLDHSSVTSGAFLDKHVRRAGDTRRVEEAMRLLESQRMALYMFTSCGWFFDDISGIETVQVMMYAARAIDMVSGRYDEDPEALLREDLSSAVSNRPGKGTGADVYDRMVLPARMKPSRLAAHVVCAGVPGSPDGLPDLLSGVTDQLEVSTRCETMSGIVRVSEPNIRHRRSFAFSRTDSGCEISPLDEDSMELTPGTGAAGELPGAVSFTYRALTPALLGETAHAAARRIEAEMEGVLGRSAPGLMEVILAGGSHDNPHFLSPQSLRVLGLVVCREIRKAFSAIAGGEAAPVAGLSRAVQIAVRRKAPIDRKALAAEAERSLSRLMNSLTRSPGTETLGGILEILGAAEALELPVDLWSAQNGYYFARNRPGFPAQLPEGAALLLEELGRRLGFR